MDFEEFCDHDLYAGLESLRNNPNYQCSIKCKGHTYINFSIDEERRRISMYDARGNSLSMDLNDFVNKVQDGKIEFVIK